MIESERDRLRQAKAEVTQRLASVNIDKYRLPDVDPRLDGYVREVAAAPQRHNLFEQLAVMRFFDMVDKYGISVTDVRRFVKFYESLYFPGKHGDQTYELTPVQVFQFASIFGFWEDGKRVVREVVLYVPRKFSKTTSTAALIVWDLLYGDSNSENFVGANSQDQAKKCFDVVRGCIRHLDPDETYYAINELMVKSKRKDRSAIAQCLTANARTKDGLNASTVVMDEFSQARDSNLLTVLTTSMGVRDNPLTVIITTASDVFDGPFYAMLEGYKATLLGEHEDDHLFAHLFEPDVDDPEDSEDTWRKVHPHIGVTVSMDFYRGEYAKAKRNGAEAMLAFRTKLLNVYSVNERRSWISPLKIKEVSSPMSVKHIGRGSYPEAMVSIDLSVRDDFSAVTVGIYDPRGSKYRFHTKYFFPESALSGHPNENLYRTWAQGGYLTLQKGDVIDYQAIVEYILDVNKHVKILHIGYDPKSSTEVVNRLRAAVKALGGDPDVTLRSVDQRCWNFNAPVEAFEHGIYTGKIEIDANPITSYCFGNAVIMEDHEGHKKPEKRSDNQKIDGVITILMVLRLFMDNLD